MTLLPLLFIWQTGTASANTAPEPNVRFCLTQSIRSRCFETKGSHWRQDAGNGLVAVTLIDQPERRRLETEITSFKAWLKSESAKRRSRNTMCQFTADFDLKSRSEKVCLDPLQGKKLDTKLATVLASISKPKSVTE